MPPILIVGGAPRLWVDAVRFLSMAASGDSAVALGEALGRRGRQVDLLLGTLARPEVKARRYDRREDLEEGLQAWIRQYPEGLIVMSAAINDYGVASVERHQGGQVKTFTAGQKVPSGADEVVIRLRPASKVIDQLPGWGHQGSLVGFKYEDRTTVLASAEALRQRTGAFLVVANSLCQGIQALVEANGIRPFPDRRTLLAGLEETIAAQS